MIQKEEPVRFYFDLRESDAIELTKRETNAIAFTTDTKRIVFDGNVVRGMKELPACMKLRYVEKVEDLPKCAHQLMSDDSRETLRRVAANSSEYELETTGFVVDETKHLYMWAHGEGDTLDGLYQDLGAFGGGADIPLATDKTNGLMSAIDKNKLDGIDKTVISKSASVARGTVMYMQIDLLNSQEHVGMWRIGRNPSESSTNKNFGFLVVADDWGNTMVSQLYFGGLNPIDWQTPGDEMPYIGTRRYKNGQWSQWEKGLTYQDMKFFVSDVTIRSSKLIVTTAEGKQMEENIPIADDHNNGFMSMNDHRALAELSRAPRFIGYRIKTTSGDCIRQQGKAYYKLSDTGIPDDYIYLLEEDGRLKNKNTGAYFMLKWSTTDDWFFVSVHKVDAKGFALSYRPDGFVKARYVVWTLYDHSTPSTVMEANMTDMEILDYPTTTSHFTPYFTLEPVFE